MIFRQILHPQTGCASYMFGCTGKGKLAVVDPHIEYIADYLAISEQAHSACWRLIRLAAMPRSQGLG